MTSAKHQAETSLGRLIQERDALEQRARWAEEKLVGAESHIQAVADAMGFPSHNENRDKTSVIVSSIENMRRFTDYLQAIEQEFLMVPGEPDDDYPDEEPDDECLVNCWGAKSRKHYVEQFRQALDQLKGQWQAEGIENLVPHVADEIGRTLDLSEDQIIEVEGWLGGHAELLRQAGEVTHAPE